MFRQVGWCWKIIKQYLANCSIHGVKYLVGEEYSYFERFFWLVSCTLCWWGCSLMVMNVVDDYFTHPVATTIETTYVNWETPFPSLAFCFNGKSETKEILKELHKKDKSIVNLQLFNPNTFGFGSRKKDSGISAADLHKLSEKITIPCNSIFDSCEWSKAKFNCCEEFLPYSAKTGVGFCLAINSRQTPKRADSSPKFLINHTAQYGDLVIDLVDNSDRIRNLQVYMLNNFNVPLLTSTDQTVSIKKHTRLDIELQDTYNENGVKSVPVRRRGCRFSSEVSAGSMFEFYSSSSCTLEVFISRMTKLCGCVSFYYPLPKTARLCNMTEMKCLFENKSRIITSEGLREICPPDCEGTSLQLYEVEESSEDLPKKVVRIHVKLLSHPCFRYRRYVVQDLLDIVVGIGSSLGLFMGASILSIFEIPYWILVRRDMIT